MELGSSPSIFVFTFKKFIIIFKVNVYVSVSLEMHVGADVQGGQRCRISLEMELRVTVSCVQWMLGPDSGPLLQC